MTIEKIDNPWAEDGALDTPTTDKQDLGWVAGSNADRPPAEWLNYLQNRVEKLTNTIVEERVNSFYDGASDHQSMISTGLWGDSWAMTTDTANTISGGSAKQYRDLGVFFNSSGESRLLVFDNTNLKIEVWDPRALTLEDTSDALTDDLPSGGGESWEAVSFCNDGTYVYCLFADVTPATDEIRLQSWLISDWSVRSGWAATGTDMGARNAATNFRHGKVIMASSTKLAVSRPATAISSSASTAISIIDITDGTIDASGAGDAPTGVSAAMREELCSDGTNVFFTAYSSSSNALYVCTATIADPTAGTGGAGYPLDIGDIDDVVTMVQCGPDLIAHFFTPETALPDETDAIARNHNATYSDMDQLLVGQDNQASPLEGVKTTMRKPFASCFDGKNIWVLNSLYIGEHVLTRLKASNLIPSSASVIDRQICDVAEAHHFSYIANDNSANPYKECVFDGRDIWFVAEPGASQTWSGEIHRLPLALFRG